MKSASSAARPRATVVLTRVNDKPWGLIRPDPRTDPGSPATPAPAG
jgi:hypothetical protein